MSAASTPTLEGGQRVMRGSMFADKQMYQAVKDLRAVEIWTAEGGPAVTGFIYGMDDYHWGLVDCTGLTMMVHKTASLVRFLGYTLDALPRDQQDKVLPVVQPFRNRVLREVFNQQTSAD